MRRVGLKLLICGLCALLAWSANQAQIKTDAIRHGSRVEHGRVFMPNPEVIRVTSLGFDQLVASAMWVRAVLMFVELVEAGRKEDMRWFQVMVKTINTLDVRWRTPYFYGGGMLRIIGDITASDLTFKAAMDALPTDPYFPFALGMNAHLYHKDAEATVRYLKRAASLPNAPRWYRTAAAGFLDRNGQRRVALRYLKEQYEMATTDYERDILLNKRKVLMHEALVEDLESRRVSFETRTEKKLSRMDQLGALPPDPFGGHWSLAADGRIRSDVYDVLIAERQKLDERGMLTRTWLGPDQ